MTEINSPQNSQFRLWKSLLEARGIKKEGLFLLSGRKIVPEVLNKRASEVAAVISTVKSDQTLVGKNGPFYLLHKPLFEQLDVIGTKGPLLVMRTPKLPEWTAEVAPQHFELLLALSDPNNLGAVLRSCAAFGMNNVVLLSECANPFLPRVIASSVGTCLNLNLSRGPSIQEVKVNDGICLDLEGETLDDFRWPKYGRLILGEEGRGLPETLSHLKKINIPMTENAESLNAAVAASIALYDFRTKS
jgi:TrmH family RNA methyltransferase